jgi:hypothetical protein
VKLFSSLMFVACLAKSLTGLPPGVTDGLRRDLGLWLSIDLDLAQRLLEQRADASPAMPQLCGELRGMLRECAGKIPLFSSPTLADPSPSS